MDYDLSMTEATIKPTKAVLSAIRAKGYHILRTRGIENLIMTRIITDVCVSTTMRERNDRGFECLVQSDCCGPTDKGNHDAALKMVTMQGGVSEAVSDSATMLRQLQ